MNSAPRVLITGSSGFIGDHLCQILKEYDIDFTRLVRTSHSLINSDQINSSRGPNLIEISWPEHLTSLDLSPYSSIVHLAHAPIKQTMSKEELYAQHIKPIEVLIERIKKSNPECHFIFLSSQSADPDSSSKYAQIKFAIEKKLEKSEIAFTIIRPGLVYGTTKKGLFGKILTLQNISPILPIPSGKDKKIQDVYIWDLVKAITLITQNLDSHKNKLYYLANPQLPFNTFIQTIKRNLHKRTILLPISDSITLRFLDLLEKIIKNPSFTKTNFLGLLNLKVMNHQEAWIKIGLIPTPLENGLREMYEGRIPDSLAKTEHNLNLAKEANYLFNSLFNLPPSPTITKRYIEAEATLWPDKSSSTLFNSSCDMSYILYKRIDPEALEMAIRKKKNILRNKLLLLSYLAEIEPDFSNLYLNHKENTALAFMHLAYGLLRTIVKTVKGHIILLRHSKCMMR